MKILKPGITPILTIALLFSIMTFSSTLAKDVNEIDTDDNKKIESQNQDKVTDNAKKISNNTTGTDANEEGQFIAKTHRSVVALFVQSLLNVAGHENGIGDQVREIARTQNISATTTASAIEKIEERNSVRTFLFGNDYKNLGVIQNELNTTNKNIADLRLLLDQTVNDADRTELNVQIQLLETERTKIVIYVMANENTFSLFGWLTKRFVK